MENNSIAAHNVQQPPQGAINSSDTDKLNAFLEKQTYAMRQLNVMFDVLIQGQDDMEINLSSYASIGWDITSQSLNELQAITTTAQALRIAVKNDVKVSAAVNIPPQDQITIDRRELVDFLYNVNCASEAFDQLDTVLKLIQQSLVDNDVQNLAGMGRESAAMWCNLCDVSQENFKLKYSLIEQGGK